MTECQGACCSSPAAIGYWFGVSLLAWAALSIIGLYWRPLHALSPQTILFAMAIGCVANWLRNRTFHCLLTAPIFVVAAILFLMSGLRMIRTNDRVVWPFVIVGVCLAFLLEWRCAKPSVS